MLARDRITITLSGRRTLLRPTLRAAIRLEGSLGLVKALAAVHDGNVSTMCDVIRIASGERDDTAEVLARFLDPSVAVNMAAARDPLMRLILAMLGIDADAEHERAEAPATDSKPVAEQLAHLYRQATGWLGWTPEVALDATPHEIMEAVAGRVEMFTAIFGSKAADPKPVTPAELDAKACAIFGGLKQRFIDRQKAA